ncbi:non-canonical purine NTP pyrophosphatase [Halocatena marina]|uniref:Non-canonical purine NTP pyrophosphatase n=1 Tax=Halocatena marina TaxID=2934937 RepID=A0ABD5YTF5_9EURY|nr:non-canonical purine NTP pyrophosphatase [Halocatena marina]
MLHYVTTNAGKVREAREYLDQVTPLDYDYQEIQSETLAPIAAYGARAAFEHVGEPVIVDDAGLFIDALDGFPGPYSAFVEETLGVEQVGQIARAQQTDSDRASASFRCVIAYCDGESFGATPEPVDRGRRGQDLAADERATATTDDTVDSGTVPVKLFEGTVLGRIVEPRGEGGFGYDPIFEHNGTTFAEMTAEEKNAISHRGRALAKFGDWFAKR